ncbi:MAG: hypothetical protein IH994_10235 [Proteobacteria bacterium]|nr:hypothetical protein [Pseudomonadota bacterium]
MTNHRSEDDVDADHEHLGRQRARGGGYLTVAALSYGVWRNWWVAFAWALAAMTALAVEKREMD